MVEAKWSGKFPSLCHGKWTLIIDGKDVSDKIPENLRTSEMETFGICNYWWFDENFSEVWESYPDGLTCEEWINKNRYWLANITLDETTYSKIYESIQKQDFSIGSCGGCM